MTDIPIMFSAPMVLATLREAAEPGAGKSMTRRLAWKPWTEADDDHYHAVTGPEMYRDPRGTPTSWQHVEPGDRLWVRENWAQNANQLSDDRMDTSVVYKATAKDRALDNGLPKPWRPSIHMPRWASRLTLIVTTTKIERLQDISEQDCEREGCVWSPVDKIWRISLGNGTELQGKTARECFWNLWTDLHGAASWAKNPEVVAMTFKVHAINIDALARAA